MCARVGLRSSLRIALVLLIGIALLPAPFVSIFVNAMDQGQGRGARTPWMECTGKHCRFTQIHSTD